MNTVTKKILLRLQIKIDSDVVLARKRARQMAFLLGFDSPDQTRISTAVSEIVRNALVHAGGGRLDFCIVDNQPPYKFIIELTDNGPGIKNLDQILSGKSEHVGLLGASRLVDKLSAANLETGGTVIQLEKDLQLRQKPFSSLEVNELADSLMKMVSANPIDEVHQQNQELLAALDLLSKKQAELDQVNLELAEKNHDLSKINLEMQLLNGSLETKVKARTSELELARDEAVLANKLKSQFVANISHEIRTPMSGILSTTELVLDGFELDSEAKILIGMAHESAANLMSIINDLLDFAKLESGKPNIQESDFYIASMIDEVIEIVSGIAKKKGLPIYKNIEHSLHNRQLIGDVDLIRRVFLNLLHNAVKFTHEGEIGVGIEIIEEQNATLRIKITVSDTGIGIAEADKTRLFQPFIQVDGSSTRNYGGTGLGLSICHGYVDLMGGCIDFESTKDKGSKFWFEVPLKVVSQ